MGHSVGHSARQTLGRSWRHALAGLGLAVIPACASLPDKPVEAGGDVGTFKGSVVVVWLGEGGRAGDGRFLFVPEPGNELTFTRAAGRGTVETITPAMMYTDGGSVPPIGKVFKGLSPWGYAPAYMIHDWLFVARHCQKDKNPDPVYAATTGVTFPESAHILEESIDALVAARKVNRNDFARSAITLAVASPTARRMWNADNACAKEVVTDDDRAKAAGLVGARAKSRLFSAPPVTDATAGAAVVSRVDF